MKTIRNWIQKHQTAACFILAYLSTWLLFLPFFLTGDEAASGILALVGLFCPAFANILISRVIAPERDQISRSKRRLAFLAVWIVAVGVFMLHVKMTSGYVAPFAIVIYAVIGLLPASVLASAFSKFPEVRKGLKSILDPRGHALWYLFALIVPWIIKWISIPINTRLGWIPLSDPDKIADPSRWMGMLAASFLYGLIFAGGLNEEAGWTGFALPRLQSTFSPLAASILLWVLWNSWHIPMYFAGIWNPSIVDLIRSLVGSFFGRFIFTWLFNRTKGGVLTAILFHASANSSFEFLPSTYVHMVLDSLLAAFLIIKARMWQKLPGGHPAVFPSRKMEEDSIQLLRREVAI